MTLLDILFPKRCVGCHMLGSYVCENCFSQISFDTGNICLVCGRPSIDGMTHPKCKNKFAIDGSFCAINYKGVVKKLVYSFKYKPYVTDLKDILIDLFFESLIQKELFIKALESKPVLIPIPLSANKLKSRGYNQAEILAQGLAGKFSLPVVTLLERIKETKPQFGLKREERIKNIQGAFGIKKGAIANNNVILNSCPKRFAYRCGRVIQDPEKMPKQVRHDRINSVFTSALLIDDILTTGTTLFEGAKVLKKNGFTKVWGLSLTRDQ